MAKFILAPRAKKDLKAIAKYSKETWSTKQRNKYLLGLEKRFHWLVKNSSLGTSRDEIKEGYYSFPHDRHVIFYTISENGNINILGILGAGQSIDKYFN